MAGQQTHAGKSGNSADASDNTEYLSPDISLNDVSFTSMTHMETVYAADKNVTTSMFLGNRMTVP
jgi:hypothetical protein